MRVCVYVCMCVGAWVRGRAPHFAEVSKIEQDATRSGRNTSTRSGAQAAPQEHKHQIRSTSGTTGTGAGTRAAPQAPSARAYKKKLQKQ